MARMSKSIYVEQDAYMFLAREERKQRGCKPLTPQQELDKWNRECESGKKIRLTDISMGGGDGTYDGRWWNWSVEELKAMLDKAGLKYENGPDFEYILV